jgi:hypothetical protein
MALTYSLNAGGTSYSVVSNSCTAGAVVIPSTNNGLPVTIIDSSAFHTCTTITSVSIPNTVTRINAYAFLNCSNLTEVTIGSGTSIIEYFVFGNCTALTRVIFLGNSPTIGTGSFNNTNANLKIYRQNLTAGWTSTFGGKPVFILSSNIIKSGGTGKITGKQRYDVDAASYFNRVQAIDGQLEDTTKTAINTFIIGCKSDGIWDAIKSSCILAGARTLNGALVPLKGIAPTNFNFINGDYSRSTGLKGNASTKYLDSNRKDNSDPQNSHHISAYVTEVGTGSGNQNLIGVFSSANGGSGSSIHMNFSSNYKFFNDRNFQVSIAAGSNLGLKGIARDSSSVKYYVSSSINAVFSQAPGPTNGDTYSVFSYKINNVQYEYSNARLSFYSIGENIDLSKLHNRLATLMSALSTLT